MRCASISLVIFTGLKRGVGYKDIMRTDGTILNQNSKGTIIVFNTAGTKYVYFSGPGSYFSWMSFFFFFPRSELYPM